MLKDNKKAIWSWAFYDWANSAFTTLILTFVYSTYFTQSVAPDPASGAVQWGYAVSISGLCLIFLGPICGAVADHTGRLKTWILMNSLLCLLGILFMGVGMPHSNQSTIFIVLTGLILANIGFELAIVFYNALLPNVASEKNLGRVSSFAWGFGYAGGLASLIVMLVGFIGIAGMKPLISLPHEMAYHIRVAIPLTVVWFIAFSWPLFLFVPDRPKIDLPASAAIRAGWTSLKKSFAYFKSDKIWRNFLIGSALYRDGLNTLFVMGGIYAAQKYDLSTAEILLFGIGMNVTAGLGAYATSFIEDKFGSFRIVRTSLLGLIFFGACVLMVTSVAGFFISALCLGFFVGPVQSASRTLVTRLSDPQLITENYGIYALTGRAAAFLGPFFYALATDLFHSQNAGLSTIIIIWVIGFVFVRGLRDPVS